jgi:regulator of sigma E protease
MEDELTGAPDEFMSKSTPKKVFFITAGVLMNFLLAAVIFSIITLNMGIPESSNTTVVNQVVPDYPAQEAGIEAGDKIIAVNGQSVEQWSDLTQIIHSNPNQEITVTWQSGGDEFTETITTRAEKQMVEDEITEVGLIGIAPETTYKDAGMFEAVGSGFSQMWWWSKVTVVSLKMLVTGQESMKSVGGPIFIAQLAGETAKSGLMDFFNLIAIISINIGFLNILPIPALDGGHLVVTLIEGVKGKPLKTKTRLVIQQIGMALLLTLMIFVIYNDIARLL